MRRTNVIWLLFALSSVLHCLTLYQLHTIDRSMVAVNDRITKTGQSLLERTSAILDVAVKASVDASEALLISVGNSTRGSKE